MCLFLLASGAVELLSISFITLTPGFIPWKKAYYRYKMLPNEGFGFKEVSKAPPAKRARLEDDEEEEPVWKHQQLFKDLEDPDFIFTNDWWKCYRNLFSPSLTLRINKLVFFYGNVILDRILTSPQILYLP
jgi:hypothetical protein